MNAGRLLQVAPPREIYNAPAGPFVADFVGSLNELELVVDTVDKAEATAQLGPDVFVTVSVVPEPRPGEALRVAVRPERIAIGASGEPSEDGRSRVVGTVADAIYLGPVTQYVVDVPRLGRIVSQQLSDPGRAPFPLGASVALTWPSDAAIVLERGGAA